MPNLERDLFCHSFNVHRINLGIDQEIPDYMKPLNIPSNTSAWNLSCGTNVNVIPHVILARIKLLKLIRQMEVYRNPSNRVVFK